MGHRIRSRRRERAAFVTVLVGIGATMFTASDVAVSQIKSDLQSSLKLVATYKEGTFIVIASLTNSGSQPLILNVGMMLANGRQQFAEKIQLQLTTPGKRLLHLRMRGPAAVGGRLDY